MNLTAPAAVAAFETAFLDMLREGPGGFGAFESEARSVALASCAEAMSRALEARDRELAASRPKGLRVHSRRPRTLATMCGDVRFRRTVLVDGAGLTRYPLDEELDLPAGDRVSPSARSFLVTCGADVPFARTAELMAIAGGSPVSATTVMDSVRSAGEAVARIERRRARDLFRDGVAPGADSAAGEVLVEAEQQHMYKVRMGSFPCAWSPEGADAMARLRSWLGSGFALPPRTRESEQSPRRRERRERKLARHLARQAGGRVESEGKGWEYPLTASLGGFRADVRYEAAGAPLGW